MNAKERVYRRLEGLEVDRVPNLNILMQYAAKHIDVPYVKFATDYRYLVEANIKCCEEFDIDIVSTMSDPVREVADLGGQIVLKDNSVPCAISPLVKEFEQIKDLKLVDPLSSKRMYDRVQAIDLYKSEVGKEYPILGWVEGPLALAADLRGINETLLELMRKPKEIRELMDFTLEQGKLFAKAQVEAGADIIGVGDAAASLIGPKLYKKIALPYEIELINYIHELGAKVKLHICGNTTKILDLMAQTGCDIVDIDWMVDLKEAVKAFEGKASVSGNYDPVKVLLQGSRELVQSEVKRCIDDGGNRIFVSAGCEVPRETTLENMMTVKETLRNYK